jgi:hypothetical protein
VEVHVCRWAGVGVGECAVLSKCGVWVGVGECDEMSKRVQLNWVGVGVGACDMSS